MLKLINYWIKKKIIAFAFQIFLPKHVLLSPFEISISASPKHFFLLSPSKIYIFVSPNLFYSPFFLFNSLLSPSCKSTNHSTLFFPLPSCKSTNQYTIKIFFLMFLYLCLSLIKIFFLMFLYLFYSIFFHIYFITIIIINNNIIHINIIIYSSIICVTITKILFKDSYIVVVY